MRVAAQQAHCAGKPRRADKSAAGLQPVQMAAQCLIVADLQGRVHRVAGARQLGQKQLAQRVEMMLLAVEGAERGRFVPIAGGDVDHTHRRHAVAAARQSATHRLQQALGGQWLDQHFQKAIGLQAALHRRSGVRGMSQCRHVRVQQAQCA